MESSVGDRQIILHHHGIWTRINHEVVIAEALACGVPVVTTDATPWKELNARGCGWCIPVGVEALEKCLREVFKMSREELAAKGAGGVDWMRGSFSWQGVGRQMVEVYAEMV